METPGTILQPTSLAEGPIQVAIVDEDPTARLLMSHWLAQTGYRPIEVATSQQAQKLTAALPDIVCIDLSMDDGAGHAVLKHLHATNSHVPVVVVMAQRDAETAVAAMRDAGISTIYELGSGTKGWVSAGQPLVQ